MKSFLLSGAIAIWATGAMAHSPLDGTTPTNEAIVSEMPAEVLMDFKGDIRLVRVAITHAVYSQHGHGSWRIKQLLLTGICFADARHGSRCLC